jgi:hypothetical protein
LGEEESDGDGEGYNEHDDEAGEDDEKTKLLLVGCC